MEKERGEKERERAWWSEVESQRDGKKRCWRQARPIRRKERAAGGAGSADREERTELPRGLEMKEPNPERAIIHSWTERGSWIRRCTRARFRRMGGELRGNSRPRRVSRFYHRDQLIFFVFSPFFLFFFFFFFDWSIDDGWFEKSLRRKI